MTNYDVEHTIKKEMSGDVRDVFVAIGNWRGPRARAGEGLRGGVQLRLLEALTMKEKMASRSLSRSLSTSRRPSGCSWKFFSSLPAEGDRGTALGAGTGHMWVISSPSVGKHHPARPHLR